MRVMNYKVSCFVSLYVIRCFLIEQHLVYQGFHSYGGASFVSDVTTSKKVKEKEFE